MRLTIITDTFPPDVNGVAMTLQRLAAGLLARGHEVEVIHPGGGDGGGKGTFCEVGVASVRWPGYAQVRVGCPGWGFLRRRWEGRRPDVLYVATEGLLGGSARRAARRLGIPVVSGYHTHFPQYLGAYGLGWLEPLVWRYLRRFHEGSWRTLVPTEDTRRLLAGQGFGRLGLLERGVDTELFQPARRQAELRESWGARRGDPVLLYVGRLAAEKNVALVFEAWELARGPFPGAKLVVVGDGPQRALWEARYPEAQWAGFRLGVELAEMYASADLLLFPSRSETFGNVLLEGMASGLPTVSYHLAASRRFVEPGATGYAACQESEEAWLRQVLRALRERRRWGQVGGAARQAVLSQSWAEVTAVFESYLLQAQECPQGGESAHPPLPQALPA